jgi:outer membrane protein assembly factor BamB
MLVLSAATGQMLGHFQSAPGDVWQLDSPTGGPDYDFGASPNLISGPDGRELVGEGSKSGTYWALDRATLKPVWSTAVGPGSSIGGILASTAYDGTRIYGDDSLDSRIWALGRDGAALWDSFDGGTLDFSPVSVANGVLYSAGPSGTLTARDAATGSMLAKLPLDGPTLGGVSLVGGAVYANTGTGPAPQQEGAPDYQRQTGNGSIIAFGDTSRSGASPRGSAPRGGGAPPPPRSPARIRLSVRPSHVEPRRMVAFRFLARRGARPLTGARIRLAGRRARTDRRGRATIRTRLPRDGTYAVRATRRGLSGGATIVAGRPGGRPHSKSGAPAASSRRAANTFQGRCTLSGGVRFQPSLTTTPQSVTQRAEAAGTCSGSFVDGRGVQHDLSDAPVVFRETSLATNSTCAGGTATGSGELSFKYGDIPFAFDEKRPGPLPLITLTGAKSGSAEVEARPASGQDPASLAQQCNGAGLTQYAFDGDLVTTPAISG